MAEKEKKTDSPEEEPKKPAAQSKRKKLWARLANRRTLAAILALSVIALGLGFIYYDNLRQVIIQSPEVALGEFKFESVDTRLSRVTRAEFSLHVSLLTDIDRKARAQLYMRRYRVQQDIEQLLRDSQGGDFEDHELSELKRQIQAQINETLDMRAIEEVIITDLEVTRAGESRPQGPTDGAAASNGQVSNNHVAAPAVAGTQTPGDPAGSSPWDTTPPQ